MHLFSCLTTVLSLPFFLFFSALPRATRSQIGSARTPSLRFCWSISSALDHLRYCVALRPRYNLSVPSSRWLNIHSLCWLSLGLLRSMPWRRDGTTIIIMRRGIQTTRRRFSYILLTLSQCYPRSKRNTSKTNLS